MDTDQEYAHLLQLLVQVAHFDGGVFPQAVQVNYVYETEKPTSEHTQYLDQLLKEKFR